MHVQDLLVIVIKMIRIVNVGKHVVIGIIFMIATLTTILVYGNATNNRNCNHSNKVRIESIVISRI